MRLGRAAVQGFICLDAHEAGLPAHVHANLIRTVGAAATRGEVLLRVGLLDPEGGFQVQSMPDQRIAGLFHRGELHPDVPGIGGRSSGHSDGGSGRRG